MPIHSRITRSSLAATAFAFASLPLTVGVILWQGALRRRDLMIDFDPFEIDLQLCERNDSVAA